MKVNEIATIECLKEGEELRIRIENGKLVIDRLTIQEEKNSLERDSVSDNGAFNECELPEIVTEIIKELGIPANIKGYEYIRRSIMMVVKNPELINAVTKKLYPEIAEEYKTTRTRVERAIRHAIEISWSRASIEKAEEIFGYTVDANSRKPTNSEYIAMIADYIRIKKL